MQTPIRLQRGTGEVVPGLICPMSTHHLDDFNTAWKDVLLATSQPDGYWDWGYKLRQANRKDECEAFAIEADDVTQGLIFLKKKQATFLQPYPLVYVEALASAPWNRRHLDDPPYFRYVGRTLLVFARQRSLHFGFLGRVGLHSVPEAEGFYRRIGMPEYPPDSQKDDLVYFEYGPLSS